MAIIRYICITAFVLIVLAYFSGCGGGDDDVTAGIVIMVVGDEEVVFDWTIDRCEDDPLYVPDLPARAFRDDGG